MKIDDALWGSIDSNIYFLSDPIPQFDQTSWELQFAVGSPFMRHDRKREFRFFKLNVTEIERTGEWNDEENARFGWGIDSAAFEPRGLKFVGYDAGLLIHLGDHVGVFAISYLGRWPEPGQADFLKELALLFADPTLEWIDLMPCAVTRIAKI